MSDFPDDEPYEDELEDDDPDAEGEPCLTTGTLSFRDASGYAINMDYIPPLLFSEVVRDIGLIISGSTPE